MGNVGCPRCEQVVSLHDGRPRVTTRGVELWHHTCWDKRDEPRAIVDETPPPIAEYKPVPSAPRRGRLVGAVSGIAVVIVTIAFATSRAAPVSTVAHIEVGTPETVAVGGAVSVREIVPPRVVGGDEFTVPTIDSVPLDRVYPSLRGWIHPVAATQERVPELASRRFGAAREGIERSECGHGHCGIDLDGPRGRAILAVAAGNVVRVERSELGADGRSGRYVRLEHDDGTLTAYMHLDDVADELKVGDRVDAGQPIGTLGATAVFSAPPHLHFSLEIPDKPGVHGDRSDTEYVDPAPFLSRARVAPK